MAVVQKKQDLHGRSEEEIARDAWYNATYQKAASAEQLPTLPADRFSLARKAHFVEILRKNADGTTETLHIPLTPAVYDRAQIKHVLMEQGKQPTLPTVASLTTLLFEHAAQKRVVASVQEHENMGAMTDLVGAPIPEGIVALGAMKRPLNGTVLVYGAEGGPPAYDSLSSATEYRAYLPLLRAGCPSHNGWCFDMPCEEVADLADQTPTMLANLREQIKNLHGVSIYMIQPRWLRYFSDGNMTSQRGGEQGVRQTSMPGGGLRPLLYDGPAWVVGLFMGEKMLPGRVFVTVEGKFICSDWCQREVDKNGGIDLITGLHTKHTLMTWCAGPGISRFGDKALTESHGKVRRAKVARSMPSAGSKMHPSYTPLALFARKAGKNSAGLSTGSAAPLTKKHPVGLGAQMGAESLRFYVAKHMGQNYVGFVAQTRYAKHSKGYSGDYGSFAVAMNFPVDVDGTVHITKGVAEMNDYLRAASFWQNNPASELVRSLTDVAQRDALYAALLAFVGIKEVSAAKHNTFVAEWDKSTADLDAANAAAQESKKAKQTAKGFVTFDPSKLFLPMDPPNIVIGEEKKSNDDDEEAEEGDF